MNRYFAEQCKRHPSMQGMDLIKLCYQETFGAEHIIADKDAAVDYFRREYAGTAPCDGPVWERIGKDMCRVNLGAWKQQGLDPEVLLDVFLHSAQNCHGAEDEDAFQTAIDDALLTAQSCLAEEIAEEMKKVVAEYRKEPTHAVHHSDIYRQAEHPAYRIVRRSDLADVISVSEAYIWDLDGTLIDSYDVIVSCLVSVAAARGVSVRHEDVLSVCKNFTVGRWVRDFTAQYGGTEEDIMREYRVLTRERADRITLIPQAKETLQRLQEDGNRHYVLTARGSTSCPTLKRLGIYDYFDEIITSENGFPHKPAPEGVLYLMKKYSLDPEHTYYVGDRVLDADCAKNAGIRSLQLLEDGTCVLPTGYEDMVAKHLPEFCP